MFARHSLVASLVLLLASSLVGCESSGLSMRETPGRDYAAYALIAHDLPPVTDAAGAAEPARPVTLPARLAVAQLGEIAPPTSMIDALRAARQTFSAVTTVPGAVSFAPPTHL